MADDECQAELANLLKAMSSLTPGYVIAHGWKDRMQKFFEKGTEDEFLQFKPVSFRADSLPSPTSTTASRPSSPPMTRSSVPSVASPRPSSSDETPAPLKHKKVPASNLLTFVPWQAPDSPPLKKRKPHRSTEDEAIDSLRPIADFDLLCTTLWESQPLIPSSSSPSSRYEILGKAINGLSDRVHVTGCYDRIFFLFVSHVVDEEENESRRARNPAVINHRSAAIERAAQLMAMTHQKVSNMTKKSNKYLRLLRKGAGLLFDIKEGKKDLWEKKILLDDIDRLCDTAKTRWRDSSCEEFNRNYLASKAIIEGLVRSGWTFSSLAVADTDLMEILRKWVDGEELLNGKIQMRQKPVDSGDSHHQDQQNQRNLESNARDVRSQDNNARMVSSGLHEVMYQAVPGIYASDSDYNGNNEPMVRPSLHRQITQPASSPQSLNDFGIRAANTGVACYLVSKEQDSTQAQRRLGQDGLNVLAQAANFQYHNGNNQLDNLRSSTVLHGPPALSPTASEQTQAFIGTFDNLQRQTSTLQQPSQHSHEYQVDAPHLQHQTRMPLTFQLGQSTSRTHESDHTHFTSDISTLGPITTENRHEDGEEVAQPREDRPAILNSSQETGVEAIFEAVCDSYWTIDDSDLTDFNSMESAQVLALPEPSIQTSAGSVW